MKKDDSFNFVYIGVLLTVMSSFIALMILSLFFGDTEIWRHKTDFMITWVILSIALSLLFLKAFIAEKQQIFQCFLVGERNASNIIAWSIWALFLLYLLNFR